LHRVADASFWLRFGDRCHLARDTGQAIARAGLEIERSICG
jgi:hypothetical protein